MEIDKKTKRWLALIVVGGTIIICAAFLIPTALFLPENFAVMSVLAALLAIGFSILSGVYAYKRILRLESWGVSWQVFKNN